MAVTTTLRTSYVWRMAIIGIVSLVLGVWGVYDYFIGIPNKIRLADQRELLDLCQLALASDQVGSTPNAEATEALQAINADISGLIQQHAAEVEANAGAGDLDDAEKVQKAIDSFSEKDKAWVLLLLLNQKGLRQARTVGDLESSQDAFDAHEANKTHLNVIGDITRPAAFDHVMQIGFILCLPFALYCGWRLQVMRSKRYTMDDDGNVTLPDGSEWAEGDIADIDMSKWMAKSIAWLVHTDGTREKLDDYIHKDVDVMVGAIASRMHPDEWKPDAKPVKAEEPADADDVAEADQAHDEPDSEDDVADAPDDAAEPEDRTS